MGICVLSSNKWQNTSTSYNIIKDCYRPAQLGPPDATPMANEAGWETIWLIDICMLRQIPFFLLNFR
jgi:hypothetical protein